MDYTTALDWLTKSTNKLSFAEITALDRAIWQWEKTAQEALTCKTKSLSESDFKNQADDLLKRKMDPWHGAFWTLNSSPAHWERRLWESKAKKEQAILSMQKIDRLKQALGRLLVKQVDRFQGQEKVSLLNMLAGYSSAETLAKLAPFYLQQIQAEVQLQPIELYLKHFGRTEAKEPLFAFLAEWLQPRLAQELNPQLWSLARLFVQKAPEATLQAFFRPWDAWLNHPNPRYFHLAISALLRFVNSASRHELMQALLREAPGSVRQRTLLHLARQESFAHRELWFELLECPSVELRQQAVQVLTRISFRSFSYPRHANAETNDATFWKQLWQTSSFPGIRINAARELLALRRDETAILKGLTEQMAKLSAKHLEEVWRLLLRYASADFCRQKILEQAQASCPALQKAALRQCGKLPPTLAIQQLLLVTLTAPIPALQVSAAKGLIIRYACDAQFAESSLPPLQGWLKAQESHKDFRGQQATQLSQKLALKLAKI